MWLYHRVTSPNDADGMANSVDPDQTAPLGSGSALFAQASVRKLRNIKEKPGKSLENRIKFRRLYDKFLMNQQNLKYW